RLRDDGTTTAGVTAVATALLLGLETRRAAHLLRFIRWLWLLLGLASLAAGGSLLRRPVLGALGFGLLVVTGASTGATAARRGLVCDIVGWRRRNHRRQVGGAEEQGRRRSRDERLRRSGTLPRLGRGRRLGRGILGGLLRGGPGVFGVGSRHWCGRVSGSGLCGSLNLGSQIRSFLGRRGDGTLRDLGFAALRPAAPEEPHTPARAFLLRTTVIVFVCLHHRWCTPKPVWQTALPSGTLSRGPQSAVPLILTTRFARIRATVPCGSCP